MRSTSKVRSSDIDECGPRNHRLGRLFGTQKHSSSSAAGAQVLIFHAEPVRCVACGVHRVEVGRGQSIFVLIAPVVVIFVVLLALVILIVLIAVLGLS